jgi:hypothetical protein
MGKELTRLHYVNCPNCQTMFKPKVIPRKLTDNIYCICCGITFQLEPIADRPKNNTANLQEKPLKVKKKNLPITTVSKKNSTDKYLKTYKLKSKIIFFSWLAMPVITLLLITNVIYQNKNELAQDENWRPFISQFCNILNCQLPTYNNLSYVIVDDNAMVSVPEKENSIQLFAMLKNIGKYDQHYPHLTIKFTDINGKIITEKLITPKDYLTHELKNKHYLAKNSKQYITMLLPDPGSSAVNYEIALQ